MNRGDFRSQKARESVGLRMISTTEPDVIAPLRPEHLRAALANAALEGLQPSSAGLADLEAVTSGGMEEEEFLARLKARYGI